MPQFFILRNYYCILAVMEMPAYPDNDAIHELRDEVKELHGGIKRSTKATERYTVILLFVALVQAIIAVVQLCISLDTASTLPAWLRQLLWTGLLIGAVWILWTTIVKKIFIERNLTED
jgi:hypothetical protein